MEVIVENKVARFYGSQSTHQNMSILMEAS